MRKCSARTLRRAAAAVSVAASAGVISLAAEAGPLKSADILGLVNNGATVHIDTPLGITLPMNFEPDGTVRGTAGKLSFYMKSESDEGRWWVVNDKLCQKWRRWFEGKTGCLSLKRDGMKYVWDRNDGKSGTATIVARETDVAAVTDTTRRASALGGPASVVPARAATELVTPTVVAPPALARRVTPGIPQHSAKPAAKPVAAPAPVTAQAKMGAQAPAAVARIALARTNPPAPTPAPQPVVTEAVTGPRGITYRVVNVRANDTLNVRSEANPNAAIVGTVPPHGRGLIMVGACAGFWCPMSHAGKTGWVNRAYLALEPMMVSNTR